MKSLLSKLVFTLAFIFIVSAGFSPSQNPFLLAQKEKSQASLTSVKSALKQLEKAITDEDLLLAKKAFHQAKRYYKSSEFILEYYHHSTIKSFVNGAPLPQIEKKVADLNVFEPQGFQRLEELIYDEQTNWNDLKTINQALARNLDQLILYHPRVAIYDRNMIEAMRFEILRIATLGITGFENPANTDSCFAEIEVSFNAMKSPAMHYATLAGKAQADQVNYLFEKGQKQLANADFNTFDRLSFIKNVSDPIFKILYQIHRDLGIETLSETNSSPIATNYNATSLFDINLLNKKFFLKTDIQSQYKEQLELGKLLFFDPALSANNSLSCSSCHHPELAFTDGKAKSLGNDQSTEVARNAPTLVNALFSGAYFHDLRADRLEKQTEHVMVSPLEFNVKPLELAEKLKKSTAYRELFQTAYPGMLDAIKPHTIQSALATYVSSLVSWDSPFDQFIRGESEELSASAQNGFNIFMGKAACGTCHFAPNFSGIVPPFYDDTESEVLGVLAAPDSINPTLDNDLGRFANGKRSEHAEHFMFSIKTPTIRNIELTGPYLHNGAFNTLEEIMWFYNNGGGAGLGLDVPNQTLPDAHLGLTQNEIKDVIAFMKSLNDISKFQGIPSSLPDFETIVGMKNRKPSSY
ncbi:MAG: cytochrome-c peroxidase [Salibacteraceae bacterium]|nr:cytochrome-c peroxidase [Salibacteraceae bacterium]